jgi:hypothetical protein
MKLSAQGIHIDRISLPRLAWFIIAIAMFWHLLYVTCGSHRKDYIIYSDAAGYYAYLPSTFIYHDPEYKFCFPGGERKVNHPGADYTLFMNITKDGKHINKYFIGTAVMELPFFLIAYGTAPLFGYHMNGYSFPFHMAIALATICYVLLGLDQLRRLLSKMGVQEYVQAIALLLVFFGTNLYYYTLGEPGMSHAFSFTMMAVFINHTYNVFHLQRRKSILTMIFAVGMIIMIRPVNGVAVFAIPFIAGSWKTLVDGIRFCLQHYWRVAAGVGIFLFLLFLQLLMYKRTAGDWFADSYNGEHLILSQPHIMEILFSWKKGWFIYTPLMFVALGGIVFLKNNFQRIAFVLLMFIAVYVVSCWELWWYGGSFGMRPMIEYYPVMAIPLALLLQKALRKFWYLLAVPVFGFILVLSLVQLYQYFTAILPYNDMTAEKYEKIFFKTSADYILIYDPGTMLQHQLPAGSIKGASFKRTFEEGLDNQFGAQGITSGQSFSGENATMLNAEVKESSGIRVQLRDAFPDSTQIANGWMVIRAKILLFEKLATPKMAFSIHEGDRTFYWTTRPVYFEIGNVGQWQDFSYTIKIPAEATPNSTVSVFMFHDDQSLVYADDFEVEFYVAQPQQ